MKHFLMALFFCWSGLAFSQTDWGIPNVNQVFDAQIRTVKLHLSELPTSQPIIDLKSSARLLLSFDDMTPDQMEYFYTIYHCTADWETSDIEPLEYLKIFDEGEIRNFYFSGRTQNPYVHYRQYLPNSEIDWMISGNYMLVVYYYDDDGNKVPVISRRFMVNENIYDMSARFMFPTETGKRRSHHEMQVVVDVQKNRLRIPQQQIRLYVYQNGRWDQSATDLQFNRFQGDLYYYNLPGTIQLPAPKEFRPLDNRFVNSPGGKIAHFERNEDGFLALLHPDAPRTYAPYITYFDLNGQYVVMNREANFVIRENPDIVNAALRDSIFSNPAAALERTLLDTLCLACEYVDILFTLQVDAPYKDDVYVFGEMTGWNLDPMFKMEYDPTRKAYFAKIQLKQGYYDYQYALASPKGIDTETIEGTSHEGENDYLLLVYDRHDFNRGDRLLGARMVNSSPQ